MRALLLACVMATTVGVAEAQSTNIGVTSPPWTNSAADLVLPTNLWIQVGEELIYQGYWGVIPVGQAKIKTEWVEENGRRLLAIRCRVLSNKFISKIYPIDSKFESLIDPVDFKSVRYTQDKKENKRKYHEITTFDYTNLTAHWESKISGKTKDFKLEKETRDLVAFLFMMRAWSLKPHDTRYYRVMSDDDIYDLLVRTKGRERVELEAYGKISCIRVEPEAAFNGLFVRKGQLTGWVSEDGRKIFTRIVADLPFANVRIVLHEVKGPGNDSWILKGKEEDPVKDDLEAGGTASLASP